MVSLPFFYSQEPEDDVTTPAPPSPVTPPSSPEKPGKPFLSLQAPEKPVEKPVRPQEKLANGQAQKVLPPIVTFDAFQSLQVLDLISCGRQLPKARWQGSRNLQLLRPSAGHRGTKSATKGPNHPKQQHWQLHQRCHLEGTLCQLVHRLPQGHQPPVRYERCHHHSKPPREIGA